MLHSLVDFFFLRLEKKLEASVSSLTMLYVRFKMSENITANGTCLGESKPSTDWVFIVNQVCDHHSNVELISV
jgi:hypothetical protein